MQNYILKKIKGVKMMKNFIIGLFGLLVWTTTSWIEGLFLFLIVAARTSNTVCLMFSGVNPMVMVRLAWGSQSTSSTRLLCSLKHWARAATVVVLPTPPFWLAIQMTGMIHLPFCF